MKDKERRVRPWIAVFVLAGVHSSLANALTIELINGGGTPQATAVGGGNLQNIVTAAAHVWEQAILDPYTVTFVYRWEPVGGAQHTLNSQGGTPNREISGVLDFNNDTVAGHFTWFMDPDPLSNSAYGTMAVASADLGGGVLNTGRYFSAFAPTVGQDVLDCLMCSDLFTTALHEIGHGLGMSNANGSFINEAVDGDIDITGPLPFAGSQFLLAQNIFGVVAHLDNSGVMDKSVMAGNGGYGRRSYLSEADILANAQLSGFTDLNLNPVPVPLPAAAPLLLSGLLGVVALARRSRRRIGAGA